MANGTAEDSVETLSDAALLQRFAKRRDEAAFAELVSRHGRLVWGVCRRRLVRREDAEDAFQAAFLILAVKAHAIRSAEALPGWLHRTACRAAIRVATASPVEATHDVPTDGLDAFAEVTRREAATAIDEELVRLPERYRNAVVLFHLEGLERRDVATRLGMSEPAVKALLMRGRALLRTRLARRGLALPMLLPLALDPVPASAMQSTCKLALAFSRAGLHPLDLVNLPAKGLKPMSALLTNKTVAATLAGVACLTLFLATRGDANTNSDGQNPDAPINTAFDPANSVEATPLLLAEAELLSNAAEEPKPADAKKATAGDPQASEPPQIIPRSPKELKIREALESDTDLQFPNTPLRNALQFLADKHEINIIIDEQALEEDGLTVDDNVDIVLSGIKLRSALKLLLERYDLTWVIEDEVLKITTQAAAERRVSTQAFDVSALVSEGDSASEVAQVVEQLLERPTFPAPAGNDQTQREVPRIVPFRDRLLVRASGADLKQVEEILELMWIGSHSSKEGPMPLSRNATGGNSDANFKIFSLEHADAAEAAKVLEGTLSQKGSKNALKIVVDQRTNSVVASGSDEQLKIAEAILLRLDESDASAKGSAKSKDGKKPPEGNDTASVSPPQGEPPRPTITLEPVIELGRDGVQIVLVKGRVTKVPADSHVFVSINAIGANGELALLESAEVKVDEVGRFSFGRNARWPVDRLLVRASVADMSQVSTEREIKVAAVSSAEPIPTERFSFPDPVSDAVADFDHPSAISVPVGSRFLVRGTVPFDRGRYNIQSASPIYKLQLYPKGENPRNTPGQTESILLLPYGDRWWFETSILAQVPPGEYEMRYGESRGRRLSSGGPLQGKPIFVTITAAEGKISTAASTEQN